MGGRIVHGMIAGALAFVVGQGCSDASGPGLIEVYRLERYEGGPLPAVIFEGGGVSTTILGAEVVLLRGGAGRMTTTLRGVDEASPQGRVESPELAFTYVVRGTRIEITYVCPPNADCLAGPHLTGERTGDRLALSPPASSKLASVYRRTR